MSGHGTLMPVVSRRDVLRGLAGGGAAVLASRARRATAATEWEQAVAAAKKEADKAVAAAQKAVDAAAKKLEKATAAADKGRAKINAQLAALEPVKTPAGEAAPV